MDVFESLAEHNREFVKNFAYGDLQMWPELTAVVVTCVDPRLEFHAILGVELGEIAILRSIGGRVTTAVLRDLSIYSALAEQTAGPDPDPLRVLLVHHTDCGAERFKDPDTHALLADRTGLNPQDIEWLAIDDHNVSVAHDLAIIRAHHGIPEGTTLAGYVYDVHSGKMTEVVPPTEVKRTPQL
jgi:carbonic anhydrase